MRDHLIDVAGRLALADEPEVVDERERGRTVVEAPLERLMEHSGADVLVARGETDELGVLRVQVEVPRNVIVVHGCGHEDVEIPVSVDRLLAADPIPDQPDDRYRDVLLNCPECDARRRQHRQRSYEENDHRPADVENGST